jgi:hypothetical protein
MLSDAETEDSRLRTSGPARDHCAPAAAADELT